MHTPILFELQRKKKRIWYNLCDCCCFFFFFFNNLNKWIFSICSYRCFVFLFNYSLLLSIYSKQEYNCTASRNGHCSETQISSRTFHFRSNDTTKNRRKSTVVIKTLTMFSAALQLFSKRFVYFSFVFQSDNTALLFLRSEFSCISNSVLSWVDTFLRKKKKKQKANDNQKLRKAVYHSYSTICFAQRLLYISNQFESYHSSSLA